MAVTTPEEFFAVLQKSKLLTPSQLTQAHAAAHKDDDPKTIAKRLARRELITRWQAGQLLAGRSSFYLGKYRLIELLGRGGMGTVFLGRHVTMNRLVALKIISRQVGKDPASLEQFLAEARAIASLDHTNIVQAYSVDNEDDRYYMVMEYVEGLDLQQMVDEDGPLDCRLAVEYIRQAAEGLDHAHQRNMIHCDIKPANLLVNVQGVVKILDMGLARLTHDERPESSKSQDRVLGSVDYLAPEQAVGSSELDYRADIYSLGCTLYFLLTGHPPFPKGTLPERILKHQTQAPPPMCADVPADLAAICTKMMTKKPDDRYSSAAEVRQVLIQWRPSSRAVPLLRAQPLRGADDSDLFGSYLDDSIRDGLADRLAKKSRLGIVVASLFATPLRSIVVVSALSLALLGPLAFVILHSYRAAREVVEPAERRPVASKSKQSSSEPVASISKQSPPSEPVEEPELPTQPPPIELVPEPSEPEPPQSEPPLSTPPKPERPAPRPPVETAPRIETSIELADTVDLPPLTEDDQIGDEEKVVLLGMVRVSPEDMLTVELVGGTEIFRSGRGFYLDQDFGSDPDLAWLVSWESEARGASLATRRDVARVSLGEDKLLFRWLEGAAEAPAGYLRNCGLLVSAGEVRGFVPLCRPKAVDPVGFDLDHPSAKPSFLQNDLPEAGALRLQILGFSAAFPNPEMAPGDTVGARKKIEISFKKAPLPPLMLRLEFDPKPHGVQIELSLSCRLMERQQFRPLRIKDVERFEAQVLAARKQLDSVLRNSRGNRNKRMAAQQQLQKSAPMAAKLTALKKFCLAVGASGKMYFRVYAQYKDRQVDLLSAPPPGGSLREAGARGR